MKKSGSSVRGGPRSGSVKGMKTRRAKTMDEPSKASLREIPPIDFSTSVSFGRGPAAFSRALDWSLGKRGRPKKGEKAAGTVTRSLRLPEAAWKALEKAAKRQGITVHALIRQAIAEKLTNAA